MRNKKKNIALGRDVWKKTHYRLCKKLENMFAKNSLASLKIGGG
jgi:hypothetical protein